MAPGPASRHNSPAKGLPLSYFTLVILNERPTPNGLCLSFSADGRLGNTEKRLRYEGGAVEKAEQRVSAGREAASIALPSGFFWSSSGFGAADAAPKGTENSKVCEIKMAASPNSRQRMKLMQPTTSGWLPRPLPLQRPVSHWLGSIRAGRRLSSRRAADLQPWLRLSARLFGSRSYQ